LGKRVPNQSKKKNGKEPQGEKGSPPKKKRTKVKREEREIEQGMFGKTSNRKLKRNGVAARVEWDYQGREKVPAGGGRAGSCKK